MTRYRLPASLGGIEHESIATHGTQAGFDLPGVSGRLWLDTADLTELPPPIPAEPAPGAYLIGGVLAVRFPQQDPDDSHYWVYGNRGPGYDPASRWSAVWGDLGGPDVSIDPMVPVPHVGLPWSVGDLRVGITATGTHIVQVHVDDEAVYLTPDQAEDFARAILNAAQKVADEEAPF